MFVLLLKSDERLKVIWLPETTMLVPLTEIEALSIGLLKVTVNTLRFPSEMFVAYSGTVTTQVSECPPSTVVTVIVAVPPLTAVTVPVLLTVTTAGLLLVHVTAGLEALPGETTAERLELVP
jgi:hypothetical protein